MTKNRAGPLASVVSVAFASPLFVSSLFFSSIAFPRVARADPSSDNRAAAQVLFDRARDLVEHNRFAEACPQFAESQRLDPGIGTLLWLADCYENTGQTASAWAAFSEAATTAGERNDPREAVARERASKLESTLSRLTIVVSPEAATSADLQIRCDGVPVPASNWGRPMPLDPGSHTITANAAGGRLWWTNLQLALGSNSTSVTVPALSVPAPDLPPAAPMPAPAETAPRAETAAPPSESSDGQTPGHTQRVFGVIVAAGGAAAVLVGAFLSLNAKATYASAATCDQNRCNQTGFDDRNSAIRKATAATIVMVGGGALLAGGAALYLAAPEHSTVNVAFAPNAGGGSVAFHLRW